MVVPPLPLLLLLRLLVVVTTALVSKNIKSLSVVMTWPCQCHRCVCSCSCRMTVAVNATAVVLQFLVGLSPAYTSVAAIIAAAVWCCCWCSHSLLCMFLKCAVYVVLIFAVHGFFTTLMFAILLCFFASHRCVDSHMSL